MSPQVPAGAQPSVGRALAAARAASGRSTSEVAAALRVREAVLEGIERDDYSLCGGAVYARGHVRAYARLLGLDPAALRGYPGCWPTAPDGTDDSEGPGPVRGPVLPLPRLPGSRRLEPSTPSGNAIAGVLLLGLVGFLGVQLVSELDAPARPSQEVAAPARVAPSASSSARPTTPSATRRPVARKVPARTTAKPTVPEGVALGLRATEDTWVAVRDAGGRTVFSGLLGKGDRKRFTDDDALRVVLGNAGGVQLTVNGRQVGPAGREGEVKRLTIRP